ncbi:MAG: sulfatase [Verrucomicrobiales bacterium]|nr:sulfatase [Verrucomicrobiales bacterium]|tara:strand:- start:1259 stop:2692 length:1434 start_codon:yes stop_codon:yes gene_type:complete
MFQDNFCKDTEHKVYTSRRDFLHKTGNGMGFLGLAGLLAQDGLLAPQANAASSLSPLAPKQGHFATKAQHIVQIFASGAPSHVDTWDYKPALKKYHGKPIPGGNKNRAAMGTPFEFKKEGQSGVRVSEVWPNLKEWIDDMAVINSMYTEIPSHSVASVMMNTGSLRLPKPSWGSWMLYGLGTLNQNLPGFISLRAGGSPDAANWQSAFLPGVFQGTSINTSSPRVEDMVRHIRSPYGAENPGLQRSEQRRQLDLVHMMNSLHSYRLKKDSRLEAQIASYEMAFKMQTEAMDAFDLSKEPEKIREMYGNTSQGRNMLLARRLIERGVRCIQVFAGGWDHHNNLRTNLRNRAADVDKPIAAFIKDLKQRGLFDNTIVMWGGEFGRTPSSQNLGAQEGRDHHSRAFSMWLAGGGIKGGQNYGESDEFGNKAVNDRVHIHDLHATLLALMGFNHKGLTYRYNGRDFRLTDNFGNILKKIIA